MADSHKHDDVYICRCEQISFSEVMGAIEEGATTLNDVKRKTRAGMGPCQGIFCLRSVITLLAEQPEYDPSNLEPMTARPPARLISLGSLARMSEEHS